MLLAVVLPVTTTLAALGPASAPLGVSPPTRCASATPLLVRNVCTGTRAPAPRTEATVEFTTRTV